MTVTLARGPRRAPLLALGIALALALPASSQAQRRRCPTCAPSPDRTTGDAGQTRARGGPGVNLRRGAPGSVVPMTDVSIAVGGRRITATVDAHCSIDPRATRGNTRFYYNVSYPWFGYRPPADQPRWQLGLSVRPGSLPGGASNELVFSLQDSTPDRSAYVQTASFAKRSGSGTVRVTRHGAGARFEFEGRTERGQAVRATIDCSEFQDGEAAGG